MFSSTGYNDVSWHNDEILTPNMENLAREGMILENAYMQPMCTPSRVALMTGYYPIHTGDQVQFYIMSKNKFLSKLINYDPSPRMGLEGIRSLLDYM